MPQAIPFVVSAVTTAFTTAVHALTVPLVSAGLTAPGGWQDFVT